VNGAVSGDAGDAPRGAGTDTTGTDTAGTDAEGAQALAERAVAHLLAHDAFSRWLGVEVLEVAPRRSVARMTVRPEMLNGFGIAHGGVAYAFADSVFAFACNSHGSVSVALENVMSYPRPAHAGDVLTGTAVAEYEPRRIGTYRVTVTNQRGDVVGLFRGTCYDTRRPLLPPGSADADPPAPPGPPGAGPPGAGAPATFRG
jgi:acyl-CoA thioesterase